MPENIDIFEIIQDMLLLFLVQPQELFFKNKLHNDFYSSFLLKRNKQFIA